MRVYAYAKQSNRICEISYPKHAKADCNKRLQRSECCFAFILDFVRNLQSLSFGTVGRQMYMRLSFV